MDVFYLNTTLHRYLNRLLAIVLLNINTFTKLELDDLFSINSYLRNIYINKHINL